jgi:hypothetical protein
VKQGREDNPNGEAHRQSPATHWLKASAADLVFTVCVVLVSGAIGVAFESAVIGGLIAIIGGMFAWAVWKEFRHRVLDRETIDDRPQR